MPRPLSKSRNIRKIMLQMISRRHGIVGSPHFQPLPQATVESATAPQVDIAQESAAVSRRPVMAGPGTGLISQPDLLTLQRAPFAVRVLSHLTAGATAASIAEFNALGADDSARLTAFVDQQLNPGAIDDSALDTRFAARGYTPLNKSLTQLWADHRIVTTDSSAPARETQRAALIRAVFSRRQLQEVMVDFWQNHFNVAIANGNAAPVYVHYNRDVIRANVFGNFRTMLEAVGQSTAMLYYLNNSSNSRSGPNENFARELLELHTFGAEN